MKINAPLALFLIQFFSIYALKGQTPTGGWGNCEFATVVSMNAFDPSGSTYTCKKAYVTATDEHYRWDGSAWVLESADVENIYNTSGTLTSDRTVGHGNFTLDFDLTGTGDFRVLDDGANFFNLKESGRIGLWTDSPSNLLHAVNAVNINPYNFVSNNVLTGERDVFTIEDKDTGGGGQDHSSVLKVWKSSTINNSDFGASLVELIYGTGSAFSDPGNGKYWISGRRTDEGAPVWGVSITGNQIWSSGGLLLNATGAANGTYSGGDVIVESDGDVGIGTITPATKLEVANGTVRLSDYGVGTRDSIDTYVLSVGGLGDVQEMSFSELADSIAAASTVSDSSLYAIDGTLLADRIVTMSSGRDLTFESTSNSRFLIDGFTGSNFANPIFQLDRNADRDLRFYHNDDLDNGYWKIGTEDGIAFELDNTDNNGLYINSSGAVGIGTSSPGALLDVDGGNVRFSDYGGGTITGTATQMLAVDIDGDVIEEELTNASGTGVMDNIYSADGSLQADRTVTMNSGRDLIFESSTNSRFIIDGFAGSSSSNPVFQLDRNAGRDLSFYHSNDLNNGYWTLGTTDAIALELDAIDGKGLYIQSSGEVGIGTSTPTGTLHIVEATGTPASASDGTIVLEHEDNGGASSLVFKSAGNGSSDYAYIEYDEDGSGNGSSTENGLLTISAENDTQGSIYQDDIALMPSGAVGIGTITPAARLDVDGGSVRFSDYGNTTTYLDTATATTVAEVDFVLGVDSEGDVHAMNTAKSAKIFYPPPIVVDASSTTSFSVDLHAAYVASFTGGGLISSTGAPTAIPTYASDELFYYITDYDNTIFSNVAITISGVLSYDVISVPSDSCSIFNVVFVVK